MIDADFEQLMNGGKHKEELVWARRTQDMPSTSVYLLRLAHTGSKGWDNSSTGRPDPIGQGEVW